MKTQGIIIRIAIIIILLIGGYLRWQGKGNIGIEGLRTTGEDQSIVVNNIVKIDEEQLQQLSIKDHLFTEDITASLYWGSIIVHADQEIIHPINVLSQILVQDDLYQDNEQNTYSVLVDDQDNVSVVGGSQEYSEFPIYISKQKVMSMSDVIKIQGGGFLASNIVAEGIVVAVVEDDLWLSVTDRTDNELIISNPLDQNITLDGSSFETVLWPNEFRYMTFIPANMLHGWSLTYQDYQLAQRQIDFFAYSEVSDEQYASLTYVAPSQLLYPGTKIDMNLRVDLDHITQAVLLSKQGDQIASYSLRPTNADQYQTLSFDLPDEVGMYALELTDNNGYTYTWPIELSSEFGLDSNHSPEDLLITIATNFPLRKDLLDKDLAKNFGSGRYELREIDAAWYEIEYHLDPYEEKDIFLPLVDIYDNQTLEPLEISIKMGAMPERFKNISIKGDSLNLLPSRGYRANKIAISHFNQPVFTLYYEPCSLASIDPARTTYHLETAMLRCGGNKITEKYVFTELTDYRETYHREIALPFTLSKESYFRVSTKPNMEGSLYFSKANLGIYTKIDRDELRVWVSQLDSGILINNGSLLVYDALTNEQLGSFALNVQQPLQIFLESIPSTLLRLEAVTAEDKSSLLVNPLGSAWWMYDTPDEGYYENFVLQSYLDTYDLYTDSPMYWRGGDSQTKIYGYTDRALYQPGDTIYFAGFVRNLLPENTDGYIPSGQVQVTLTDINGQEVGMSTIDQLDDFGGFGGDFSLRDTAKLGYYYMLYEFNGEQLYSHDLRVEEYQKPTFFIDDKLRLHEGTYELTLTPEYYMGGPLEQYDLKVTYTIAGNDACWYCRWWNEDEYYYNHLFDNTINTGSSIMILGWTGGSVILPVLDIDAVKNQGATAQLKVDIKITDKSTDETQFVTLYRDLDPQVIIGLDGQPSDRIDSNKLDEYKIALDIADGIEFVDKIVYEWYYQPFTQEQQFGVDANWYYIQGRQYEMIDDGSLSARASAIPVDAVEGAGRYLLTVSALDQDERIRGQVQKELTVYRRDNPDAWQGTIGNNYKLLVHVPKKEYTLGESIPISIDPYVSGATLVVTVEKGYDILYQRTMVLSGGEILIPVQEQWYPNVNISVMQMVGEQLHPSTSKRQEPRFYAGYTQVDLSQDMIDLIIELETDKSLYEPGETMILTVTTKDSQGNLVDARLSVGVVDKALHDLYALVKQPIPYFYNKVGSLVSTYTNLKMLYQMLQVFSAGGEKGGGGGDGGFQSLGTLRDEFLDTAFWQSDLLTIDGKAELRIVLPDNLTTWMVDVIGISKDIKLGSTTSEVTVAKPFLIEANLPTFVTIGDKISLPAKLIATEEIIEKVGRDTPIKIAGSLSYPGSEDILLDPITVTLDQKVSLDFEIPYDAYDAETITLSLAAVYGTYTDGTVQKIPLRKDGFILHDYIFSSQQQGREVFSIPQQQRYADIHFSAALLPIQAFDQAFDYLLHYPYGCTEQLMSSLYPIATALLLKEGGYLDDKYINDQGDIALQSYGSDEQKMSTADAIYDGLNQIFDHQQPDGGFSYREFGDSVYQLSAYIYGGLMLYRTLGYDIPVEKIDRLVSYLNNLPEDTRSYLYYQRQRAQYTPQEVRSADIVTYLDTDDQYALVLGYATLIALGDEVSAAKYNQLIDVENLKGTRETYGVYLDDMIIQSIYLRALIDSGELVKSQRLLTQILKQRDMTGRRGWSTQRNVQGLLTVADYLTVIGGDEQAFSCDVSMGNRTQTLESPDGDRVDWLLNLATGQQVTVNRSCDTPLFVDLDLAYLYTDLSQIADERVGVDLFERKIPSQQGAIGDKVTFKGEFILAKDAAHLAVEYYLPSTFKFLETISKKGKNDGQRRYNFGQQMPFDITGHSGCYPDHWEIRFDRLFLYYDELPAKSHCGVAIAALRAYEGVVNVMPARLREMYDTNVYARDSISN